MIKHLDNLHFFLLGNYLLKDIIFMDTYALGMVFNMIKYEEFLLHGNKLFTQRQFLRLK